MESRWYRVQGDSPIITTAIHDGHDMDDDLLRWMLLTDEERLREEDPHTGFLGEITDSRVVVNLSRFQADMNRSREKAIYRVPEDAWGLRVWDDETPSTCFEKALNDYDEFYEAMLSYFARCKERHGKFIVYDIHTYNHRRSGADEPPADPVDNPEINVGTGSLDKEQWGRIVDEFMTSMSTFDYGGRTLDVRENIKFTGGHFSRWIHQHFPNSACVLSIEFKKIFMDEWSGEVDRDATLQLREALRVSCARLVELIG